MKVNGVNMKPAALLIAGLFSATGYMAVASATSLPANVVDIAKQLNITVQSDGSFTYNGTTYVSLLPSGYSSSQPASGSPVGLSDGSIVWGTLQFAPIVQNPGELPHLPDNLQPLPGNALPSDFNPPAGFVPTSAVPLPANVKVPALSPADMLKQMVAAGALPAGVVTFNSDGTVAVKGGSSFLPFLPPTSQQGGVKDPAIRSIQYGADGSVTFPDGSTYAPLVSGSLAGGTTLPSNFTPPAGTSLPATVSLPPQFEIPPKVQIPSGMTLPVGVVIPSGYTIPTGTTLPPGVSIPTGTTLPAGVTVPKGITLPAGTQLSSGAALPQGTTVLPNGEVVIPGDKIPTGVTPPSNWTPPTGATKASDGSYTLPTPPATGFLQPMEPLAVNKDGSTVMPKPPAGMTLPAGAVVNADGSYTVPAPAFIGSVGSGGVVQAPSFGVTMPAGFTPQVSSGTALSGAGSMPSGCAVPTSGALAGTFASDPPSGPGGGGGFTPPPEPTPYPGPVTSTPPTSGTGSPPTSGTIPGGGTIPPGGSIPTGGAIPTGGSVPTGGTMPTGGNPLGGIKC